IFLKHPNLPHPRTAAFGIAASLFILSFAFLTFNSSQNSPEKVLLIAVCKIIHSKKLVNRHQIDVFPFYSRLKIFNK
ncbi:MAG TPA: hypothetical protein PKD91_05840, partial [Bacteroidia bacterium]|nr:hypothetical protein [Bacteroidia bacterium]